MNWSLSLIITLAISLAVCIVIVMMTLGAMNVTSPVARYAGMAVACAIGFLIGQMIHRKYVA
jgi:hypothetical protein